MNFFERQDAARQKTLLLVALFLLATSVIILAVNAALYLFFIVFDLYPYLKLPSWWQGKPALYTSAITGGMILAGSVRRLYQLRSGGAAVAHMAQATPVRLCPATTARQKYINIVEEMSIASGIPVPQMYIMEKEATINAFVAGYKPGESVVVITQGALENLTRDELQGVIGHEFSHLLNGDIRINLQLIAALAGITVIGQTGKFLMQQSMGSYSRSAKQSSFFRRSGRGGIGLALFGVLLWLIGCIGLWVGRLIKAAISRQREFLADASAVQFTRSTEGLAGALFKIGLLPGHAILKTTPHAEELNHLCFGESIPLYKEGWMASHPPIEKRIEALSPGLLTRLKARHKSGKLSLLADRLHSNTTPETATGFVGPETGSSPLTHAPNSAQIGAPTPTQMNYAQQLLAAIPQYVRESLNDPEQAKTCLNLLIHLNQSNAQLAETRDKKESLLAHWITQSPPTLRFPLVELATPALKTLSKSEKADFLKQVLVEVKSDGNISRFEFALLCYLDKHLTTQTMPIRQISSLTKVQLELNQVLAYLASSAHTSISVQEQLLHLAHRRLWGPGQVHTESVKNNVPPPLGELHRSIKKLAALTPLLKQPVLEVFEDLVREDGLVRPEEYEALRMLSEVLDCPMPLLLGAEGVSSSITHR